MKEQNKKFENQIMSNDKDELDIVRKEYEILDQKEIFDGLTQADDSHQQAEKMTDRLIQVYRLLQLFCEGHNSTLQNYLRVQTQEGRVNGKSFNFIGFASHFFGNLEKFINIHCVELGDQLIEFLIESLQGPCLENQLDLSRNKIVDFVKDFVSLFPSDIDYRRRGFSKETNKQIDDIMTKSTTLLISLLEGNNNQEIRSQLCDNLDFKFLKRKLEDQYVSYITEELSLQEDCPPEIVSQCVLK